MSITVDYRGRIFDPINDDEARMEVAHARAVEMVNGQILRARAGQELAVLRVTLAQLLAGLISYHIQASATIGVAVAGGAGGLSNRQCLDQLNYIALLCGEDELVIEQVTPKADAEPEAQQS